MNQCDEYEFVCLDHKHKDMNGFFLQGTFSKDLQYYKFKEHHSKTNSILSFNNNHPIKKCYDILRKNERHYYNFFTKI